MALVMTLAMRGLAGADLTQIPGVPDQTAVDKLIDWRNKAGITYYAARFADGTDIAAARSRQNA